MLCICLLNALGKPKWVSFLMGFWAAATWVLGLLFLPQGGWASWGWINLTINVLNVVFYVVAEKASGVRLLQGTLLLNGVYVGVVLALHALGL